MKYDEITYQYSCQNGKPRDLIEPHLSKAASHSSVSPSSSVILRVKGCDNAVRKEG